MADTVADKRELSLQKLLSRVARNVRARGSGPQGNGWICNMVVRGWVAILRKAMQHL
jgi:hypothetical protein